MTSDEAKKMLVDFLRENRIGQKEFAEMIGKTEVTISRWLNSGKPLNESNINAIRFIIGMHPASKDTKEQEEEKPQCDEFLAIVSANWHHLTTAQRAEIAGTVKTYAEQKLWDDRADVSEKSS